MSESLKFPSVINSLVRISSTVPSLKLAVCMCGDMRCCPWQHTVGAAIYQDKIIKKYYLPHTLKRTHSNARYETISNTASSNPIILKIVASSYVANKHSY